MVVRSGETAVALCICYIYRLTMALTGPAILAPAEEQKSGNFSSGFVKIFKLPNPERQIER